MSTFDPSDFPKGVVLSAVGHEGLSVHIDGKPGRLAIIDEAGNVVSSSWLVAQEVESVVINAESERLIAAGRLRVLSDPTKR